MATKKRPSIYAEDAGDDARYAFIPGRAPDDHRLQRAHWVVLAFLGRRNNNYGWWGLNQSSWCKRLRMTRQTLCSTVSELVLWKYLEKRSEEIGGSLCQYRVRDYDPSTDDEWLSARDDNYACRPEATGCSPASDDPVGRSRQPYKEGTRATPDLETKRPSPPLPPQAASSESERAENFEQVLSALRAKCPDATRAIDELIDPLLRFREYRAPDKVFSLSQIAQWAEHHGSDVLADAKRRAMEARDRVLDPAVIEKALKAAIAEHRKTEHLRPTQAALDYADAHVLAKGQEVCKLLRTRLGDDVFDSWFSSIVFERASLVLDEGHTVTASVGGKFIKQYIETNYADALQHCAARVFGHGARVVLSERAGRAA